MRSPYLSTAAKIKGWVEETTPNKMQPLIEVFTLLQEQIYLISLLAAILIRLLTKQPEKFVQQSNLTLEKKVIEFGHSLETE